MKELYDTLKEYDLKPKSYQKLGKAILVGTNNGHKYVVKEKVRDNNTNIYKYLESRSFNYYPKILSNEMDDYEITEYVEETPTFVPNKRVAKADNVNPKGKNLRALLRSETPPIINLDNP